MVLVIALGVGLALLGQFIEDRSALGAVGWVGYAPLSPRVAVTGGHRWGDLVLWLALTMTWAAASMVILRTRRPAPVPPLDRSSDASRSA